uniref:NADH-ubiquinone oxidoreductase chain 5 n=1 Tax=Stereobalanus canadensis TaxID=560612 RepID=A0A3S7SG20_9BILA|nr:NADH dehydrogenase subunit 5 [Stereobalanus canadensis]AXY64131.1 NADH dehydrogenase subunit 5 [Stereobalanus canadensis]
MYLQPQTIILTSFIISFILLLLASMIPQPDTKMHMGITPTSLMKTSFVLTLPATLILLMNPQTVDSSPLNWLSVETLSLQMNLHLDIVSMIFVSVATFITSAILEFSTYYMPTNKQKKTFLRLLLLFLLAMIVLVTANNLFQLLVGWEGVGLLSFLLIGWWSTRAKANLAALQAMMYNRLADMGMLLASAVVALSSSSWTLNSMILSTDEHLVKLFLLGCLTAAVGKSAQFLFHPWLPAAMEGPTPVSALLHSSTMVVAGVFLLLRMAYMIPLFPAMQMMMMNIGALTSLFAATTAIAQFDLKKIIALSTTSQLGLMMFAMGLGLPVVAFFHMCTHGFFKALLFLCSGSIMHNTSDEQDIRKLGGLNKMLPMTTACISLGSFALFGVPFLAGFYSKHFILEMAASSFTNLMPITLAITATGLTTMYSLRMMLTCFSSNSSSVPLNPASEEDSALTNPLKLLSIGAATSGALLLPSYTPWQPPSSPASFMTGLLILTLLMVMMTHVLLNKIEPINKTPSKTFQFLTQYWLYQNITHFFIPSSTLFMSLTPMTRLLDQGWGETIGAQGMNASSHLTTNLIQNTQSGLAKQYLALIIVFALICLLIL